MRAQSSESVSIRLGQGESRNIKALAERLGVRESDVIQFAIKSLLRRVSPLCDEGIRGRTLMPVLLEGGGELIRHFEFDTDRLDALINNGADETTRVERSDIALLTMSSPLERGGTKRAEEGQGVTRISQERSLLGYLYDKFVRQQPQVKPEFNGEALRPAA